MLKNSFLVLLADDEAFSREILEERLRTLPGVAVESCANGMAARDYLLCHKVDMLITDILMPGMDGLELCSFCHRLDPDCGIVLVSGYSEFEYARKALQFGVRDYLLKPVQVKSLLELVTKCQEETQRRRLRLVSRSGGEHGELERLLKDLVFGGEVDKRWLSKLKTLMPKGGRILRLETEETREEALRGLLCAAFPGQTVLCLCAQDGYAEYLLTDRENPELQRDLSAGEEFLRRVLECEVSLRPLGRIETAAALGDYRVEMPDSEQKNEVILLACRYMEAHLSEPITRDQVAQAVYLTSPYFSSLFKKVTGMTYSDYLVEIRISRARKLLRKKLSIRDIAEAVGYQNLKYFNRIFKNKVGCLPSEYRRRLLKGNYADEGL